MIKKLKDAATIGCVDARRDVMLLFDKGEVYFGKTDGTVYQVTDSYHFNDKHSAGSYLNSIAQILTIYDLTNGVKLSGYIIQI